MNIIDDHGVERPLRSGAARTSATVDVGLGVASRVVGVLVVTLSVFALSCGVSAMLFDLLKLGPLVVVFAVALGLVSASIAGVAFVIHVRRTINGGQVRNQADSCKACGYNLSGLAVEPDGCRVCPECGAAWWASVGEAGDAAATRRERL